MRFLSKTLRSASVLAAIAAAATLAHAAVARQTKLTLTPPGYSAVGFLLYLPADYAAQPADTWPLLVFLHGSGQRGTNPDLVAVHGPPKLIEQGWDFPAIVVSPQCSGSWWDSAQLEAFFAQLATLYRVDPDRVYVTGLSMGGYATWDLAVRHPENYGAVIPICGAGTPSLANRLVDLPLWAFHGALDTTVAPVNSQNMIAGIRAAGGTPLFTLYPNLGHDCWTVTYANADVYAWLFAQSRLRVPTIAAQPTSLVRAAGESASFAVTANGGALAYQWRRNGLNLIGATQATFALANLSASDAGEYSVVITNEKGEVASAVATLAVQSPPVVVSPPVARVTSPGGAVEFSVVAGGGDLSYQWRRENIDLAGANDATLRIAAADVTDVGDYTVIITNPRGTVTTSAAHLSLAAPAAAGRLANLSIRGTTAAGEHTLIAGFYVGGAGAVGGQPLLLRAVGPSLADHNVTGFLADPALLVFEGATLGPANADWRGDSALVAAATATGAFDYTSADSGDAAILTTLLPGGHTLHVTCNYANASGVALAECYDAASTFTATSPRLINISGRGYVSGGENILIAGFSIVGATPVRVLVRAIGPTLTAHNVTDALADPVLQVFTGQIVLVENNDWSGDAALAATFPTVGAFDLPADSKDAALLVTLPAGNYTAQATSATGLGGVALVEVFEVP